MSRQYLKSWANPPVQKPLTRNQRFRLIIKELNKKPAFGRLLSRSAKLAEKKHRAELIATNPTLIELFDWIFEIQENLNLKDREFARELGISKRMLYYYKSREGHIPSQNVLRKLFELEKLCRTSVVIVKNIKSFVKLKPIHVINIE